MTNKTFSPVRISRPDPIEVGDVFFHPGRPDEGRPDVAYGLWLVVRVDHSSFKLVNLNSGRCWHTDTTKGDINSIFGNCRNEFTKVENMTVQFTVEVSE